MSTVFNAVLIVSIVVGLPAVLVLLWALLRGAPVGSPRLLQLSRGILMTFGGLAILGGILVPILLSQTLPPTFRTFGMRLR